MGLHYTQYVSQSVLTNGPLLGTLKYRNFSAFDSHSHQSIGYLKPETLPVEASDAPVKPHNNETTRPSTAYCHGTATKSVFISVWTRWFACRCDEIIPLGINCKTRNG